MRVRVLVDREPVDLLEGAEGGLALELLLHLAPLRAERDVGALEQRAEALHLGLAEGGALGLLLALEGERVPG